MTIPNVTAVPSCHTDATGAKINVIAHYQYDCDGVVVSYYYTGTDGVIHPTADETNTTAGACAMPTPDVEWELLCDKQADGSKIEFERRSITSFDASGAATSVVADFALDRTTAYTVTGTVGKCGCAKKPVIGRVTNFSQLG